MGLRVAAATWAGKVTALASRLTRRGGGTTLPGDVARALAPGVLRSLAGDLSGGTVLVTGTNGKTTTARLIAGVLEGLATNRPVVSNRAGANLIYGLTAAAVKDASWRGRLARDWAVFEVDENTLPAAVAETRPRAVVVTNLFRDQLDRYGELELTAHTIQRALEVMPESGVAVLNADDPRVAEIGLSLARTPRWYGLDDASVAARVLPHAADATTCPVCGSKLDFAEVYVGHDGNYSCPNGDFGRPRRLVTASHLTLEGLESLSLELSAPGGPPVPVTARLGGLYNAYNLTAAFAVCTALGLDPVATSSRLGLVAPAFGRLERVEAGGRRYTLLLSKNPTGWNENLKAVINQAGGRHLLVALNDRIADGRDVSWIWDVDFELLMPAAAEGSLVVTGSRASDLAVRLKYGGVDPRLLSGRTTGELGRALDLLEASVPAGGEAYCLCTYTAMLELRAEMVRRGWLRDYWRT